MAHKIYEHLSNAADIEKLARLSPYQTAEIEHPKKMIDWQPWVVVGIVILIIATSCFFAGRASAQTLKEWFNSLSSEGGGVCCMNWDGNTLIETEWKGGAHYQIIIDGQWVEVPDDRVVQTPNLLGVAHEWHYYNQGKIIVRCFLPGLAS